MSLTDEGQEGERLARLLLKKFNFKNLMQLDWCAQKGGQYFQFEIKKKGEPFKPPPFWGHGLEKYQCERRLQFYKDKGLRCGFIVFDGNKVYYQWLDVLYAGKKFETKNGILIFSLENFKVLPFADSYI